MKRPRQVAGGLRLRWAAAAALCAIPLIVACSTTAKRDVAKTALDSMSQEQRRDAFEASIRALEEDPERIDELYTVARKHDRLLDRFMANAVKDLAHKPMAEMAGRHLVTQPDAVEQTMGTTIELIAKTPPARQAMNRALRAHARTAVDIAADSPDSLSVLLDAGIHTIESKPKARQGALVAVRKNRERIVALVKEDPELMKAMTAEVVGELVKDKPLLEKALRAAKVINDDGAK